MINPKPIQDFLKAIYWLNQNEQRIKARADQYPNGFDYPAYFDMPQPLAARLEGWVVDWLYEETATWTL